MPSERVQRHIDRLLDEADQAVAARDWATVRGRVAEVLTLDSDNADARALGALAERGLANEAVGSRQSAVGAETPNPSVGSQFIAPADAEPPATPSGDAAPPPEPTLLASLPAREGGTIADASAVPAGSVGEDALSSRALPITGGLNAPAPSTTHDPRPTTFLNRYKVIRFLGEGGKKQVYLAHDIVLDRDVAFALIKTEGLDETGRRRISREGQAMGTLGAHPHIVTVFDLGEILVASSE